MLQNGICKFLLQVKCSAFCLHLGLLLLATGENFPFGKQPA